MKQHSKWSKKQHLAEWQKPQVTAPKLWQLELGLVESQESTVPKVRKVLVQEWGTVSWPSCCLAKEDCKIIIAILKELALMLFV